MSDIYTYGLPIKSAQELKVGEECWVLFNYTPDRVYCGRRIVCAISPSHVAFNKIYPKGTLRNAALELPRALHWSSYGEDFIVFRDESSAKLVYTWLKYGM